MKHWFFGILCTIFATPLLAAECDRYDQVVIPSWSPSMHLTTISAAMSYGLDREHCVELTLLHFNTLDQILSVTMQGVENATVLGVDLAAYQAHQEMRLQGRTEHVLLLVGHQSNSSYRMYMLPDRQFGDGARIAVSRCGWKDQDVTIPRSRTDLTEARAVAIDSLLPPLRTWALDQNLRIYCGGTVPDGFSGVQLLPLGTTSKRQAALDNPRNTTMNDSFRVDGIVHSQERAEGLVQEGKLVPVSVVIADPLPEYILSASAVCLADRFEGGCRDVIVRAVSAIEAARQRLERDGVEAVTAIMQQTAAEAVIANQFYGYRLDDPAVAKTLAQFYFDQEIVRGSNTSFTLSTLQQLIEMNGWDTYGLTPGDLVDKELITLR